MWPWEPASGRPWDLSPLSRLSGFSARGWEGVLFDPFLQTCRAGGGLSAHAPARVRTGLSTTTSLCIIDSRRGARRWCGGGQKWHGTGGSVLACLLAEDGQRVGTQGTGGGPHAYARGRPRPEVRATNCRGGRHTGAPPTSGRGCIRGPAYSSSPTVGGGKWEAPTKAVSRAKGRKAVGRL